MSKTLRYNNCTNISRLNFTISLSTSKYIIHTIDYAIPNILLRILSTIVRTRTAIYYKCGVDCNQWRRKWSQQLFWNQGLVRGGIVSFLSHNPIHFIYCCIVPAFIGQTLIQTITGRCLDSKWSTNCCNNDGRCMPIPTGDKRLLPQVTFVLSTH